MGRFQKRPVEIDAWRVKDLHHAAAHSWKDLPEAIVAAYDAGGLFFANHPRRVEIKTLEGLMVGNIDDWVIRGVKGELYPCKPDIFDATYDEL